MISPIKLLAAVATALAGCAADDTPAPRAADVPAVEFRILSSNGNVLPPDSGGFSYHLAILGDLDRDHVDIYYEEEGRREGAPEREVRWLGELRGAEFEQAKKLAERTRWVVREEPKQEAEHLDQPVGGSYASFTVTANNGRFAASGELGEWQKLAALIEQRARSSGAEAK